MGVFKDRSGEKHGRLTLVKFLYRNKNGKPIYECLCDCGSIVEKIAPDVFNGKTKSCGCLNTENTTKHGLSTSRIYRIWKSMKSRCIYNKETSYYKNGVTICEEWIESFERFYEDMKEGYSDHLVIDRIDGTKGYYKENCRWVTNQQNCWNTRGVKMSKSIHKGVHWNEKSQRWQVKLILNNECMFGGSYENETPAALKYNKLSEKYHGDFAHENQLFEKTVVIDGISKDNFVLNILNNFTVNVILTNQERELTPSLERFGHENHLIIRIHGRGTFEGDSRSYLPDGLCYHTVDVWNTGTEQEFHNNVEEIVQMWLNGENFLEEDTSLYEEELKYENIKGE